MFKVGNKASYWAKKLESHRPAEFVFSDFYMALYPIFFIIIVSPDI